MQLVSLAVVFVAATGSFAAAEGTTVIDGPPGSDLDTPARPPAPPPRTPAVGVELAASYVGGQQGLVTGTALTVPEGQVELAVRSALPFGGMLSIAGGVTSTTELWADVGYFHEFEDDGMKTYAAGIKQVVAKGKNAQLAVTGSVRTFDEVDDSDTERIAMVGGVVTIASDNGGLIASAGLSGARLLDDSDDDTVVFGTLGLSLGSDNIRFLAELVRLHDEGSIGFTGVRLGGNRVAFDVGTLIVEDEGFIPLPILSLRGRM
jgi:hypothetical protein